MMARETRVALGPARRMGGGAPLDERAWRLIGDTFVMRADGEHYFRYRHGEGVTVERGLGADVAAEALWLAGTVHAAIACLNGLIPIHASAIAHRGAVYAFTGPSGAGKSTLIAALGALGLPMVCDDTLVLDPAPDRVMCLPGHKRLKLTPEAIALTGALAQEPVQTPAGDDARGKLYAAPPAGDLGETLPLAALFVLDDGDPTRITPITGGAKLRALCADHTVVDLLAAAGTGEGGRGGSSRAVFERLGGLAARIDMLAFARPRDGNRLFEGAARILAWLEGRDGP